MQVSTGQLYSTKVEAIQYGVPPTDLVEVTGTQKQVEALSASVRRTHNERERARARRAVQKQSRRANR